MKNRKNFLQYKMFVIKLDYDEKIFQQNNVGVFVR